ncbi:MAG TPA: 50S ribosomal protein L5 [Candidatus Colwellbacteria bacterium]|nr:50S ribosomal protein L5 [Candidatus Colwellbacteria bacterium]HQA95810.1 50S ribosomal protein L5 [Candidatus Colwellbacteria bacterium]
MQSDYLEKIIVSAGVGKLRLASPQFEEKALPEIMKEFAAITGQKPAITKAKKSIAGFKVRQGEVVGLKAVLRGKRMNDFLSRVVNVVLPRVRDFRGLSPKSIDQNGNLSFGFRDQLVFPEINPETSRVNFGIEVTLVSRLKNKEKAIDFYRSQGIPLAK